MTDYEFEVTCEDHKEFKIVIFWDGPNTTSYTLSESQLKKLRSEIDMVILESETEQ